MESIHQNISEIKIAEIQHKLSETILNYELKQMIKMNQKLNPLSQVTVFLSNYVINTSTFQISDLLKHNMDF